MPEEQLDSQAAIAEAEKILEEAQLDSEAKVCVEKNWRKHWQEEQASPKYKQATQLADQLQQLLAQRGLTCKGQYIPENTYAATELLMRAVGELLENPIKIINASDVEAVKQQEEPTGSRRYFINRIAGALNRLGFPGSILEKISRERDLV